MCRLSAGRQRHFSVTYSEGPVKYDLQKKERMYKNSNSSVCSEISPSVRLRKINGRANFRHETSYNSTPWTVLNGQITKVISWSLDMPLTEYRPNNQYLSILTTDRRTEWRPDGHKANRPTDREGHEDGRILKILWNIFSRRKKDVQWLQLVTFPGNKSVRLSVRAKLMAVRNSLRNYVQSVDSLNVNDHIIKDYQSKYFS